MSRNMLFKILACLVISICIVNFFASTFHWYYSIWYFDMIMHFLGGAWLGLLAVWLLLRKSTALEQPYGLVFKAIVAVFILGAGWELYEALVDYSVVHNFSRFNLGDTFSDVCCDLAGGILATLFAVKNSTYHPLPPPPQGGENFSS